MINSDFVAILLALGLSIIIRRLESTTSTYPPGPRAYPIIGNIFHAVPMDNAWLRFFQLKQTYGNLMYFHGLGQRILVVNSMNVLSELLDKRSKIYSDRPTLTLAGELMELDKTIPLGRYGKEWREQRKLAHIALSPASVKKYHKVQEDIATSLCRDLVEEPENFFSSVRLAAGRLILSVTYGIHVENADDKYITHAEASMEMIGLVSRPGTFLCDLVPAMKHLPAWLPFQKIAQRGRSMVYKLRDDPFLHVKREITKGTATPSFVANLLDASNDDPEYEERLRWTAGSMFGAGGETTFATVLTFMLAMALHPEAQKTAQHELDAVLGTENSPTIADRERLPYIGALIKETMRWHPIAPLSIAHFTTDSDVYEGYVIPEGTIVMPNIWAVAFEPNDKYDPRSFIPERFLDSEQTSRDPGSYAFGFGRRICPGKALAEDTVFIMISSILASINISPSDEEIRPEFEPNLVSYPKPFKCRITPRFTEPATSLNNSAEESKT